MRTVYCHGCGKSKNLPINNVHPKPWKEYRWFKETNRKIRTSHSWCCNNCTRKDNEKI